MKNSYKLYGLSLVLSFIAMYSITYTNVASIDHITFSVTRLYRTSLMVLGMAVIMLLVMRKMFPDKALNKTILVSSILLFFLVFGMLRTQAFIEDDSFMRAMIPHHSSAILKSEQSDLSDPQVRDLAMQIIQAQREEIEIMKGLLEGRNMSHLLYNR